MIKTKEMRRRSLIMKGKVMEEMKVKTSKWKRKINPVRKIQDLSFQKDSWNLDQMRKLKMVDKLKVIQMMKPKTVGEGIRMAY